jgi:hypothetical protein
VRATVAVVAEFLVTVTLRPVGTLATEYSSHSLNGHAVNESPVRVSVTVLPIDPSRAVASVKVSTEYARDISRKLTPRADEAGPVALVTVLAVGLLVNAPFWNSKVMAATSLLLA